MNALRGRCWEMVFLSSIPVIAIKSITEYDDKNTISFISTYRDVVTYDVYSGI